jgi:hypothetical protein
MHTQTILESSALLYLYRKPSICLYRAPGPTPVEHPPRSPGADCHHRDLPLRRRRFHRAARASLEPAATATTSHSSGAASTVWPWSRQPFLRAHARRPHPRPPNPPPRALGRPPRPPTPKLDATCATSDAPGPPPAPHPRRGPRFPEAGSLAGVVSPRAPRCPGAGSHLGDLPLR